MSENCIDTTIDLHFDASGKDPDRYSATMRRYHRILWSKPLPNGAIFTLEDTFSAGYLRHRSELGNFRLSSDTVIRTFRTHKRMAPVVDEIPEAERAAFSRLGYTIGGMMVFPGNQIDGKYTINQARGTSTKIEDRFDLTLESIRRYYAGEESPLSEVLTRYSDFFELFVDFRGYVEFFLLQDLVTADFGAIRFFAPFDDFTASPLPANVDDYVAYRELTVAFVSARNARIDGEHGCGN